MTVTVVYTVLTVGLAVALIIQTIAGARERRELLDRLMARNLSEYKAGEEDERRQGDRLRRHREVIKRWRQGGGDC